ncbi:MAG: VIT1/CCC1 transporter family protein [Candidatus Omnitrophica bacterium]|nr:VIT1/CCC1 transporter family protein [Candidatus Omnitrophota bacterium]MBL7151906.1 VIT1/CCC1 transporter family protein [Candidatus Omnitrophota bacterium]
MLSRRLIRKIAVFQETEISEHIIYKRLSRAVKDKRNREVLNRISEEELKHYNFWKKHTGRDVPADNLKVWWYYLISRIFGLTFGVKLMENNEGDAQVAYRRICEFIPEAKDLAKDEEEHENKLLNMIDEERLKYVGSVVLGLNDALVELTGALAGFTLAFANTRLIATAGLITGVAASLSMAASEYLSTKSEEHGKDPVKSCIYTGIAYIFTVAFLIFPFLVFKNLFFCLGVSITNAIIVILLFTFYISVARGISFRKRFFEMALISLGVAALSFALGFFIKSFLHLDT